MKISIHSSGKSISILLLMILACFCSFSTGYSVRNVELPTPRVVVVPVDSTNPSIDEIVLNKPPNSEIIAGLGEEIPLNSFIKLECDAAYPIQFIYTGDGMPEYTTNTSQSTDNQPNRGPQQQIKPATLFEAQLYLGYGRPLGSSDTGKYSCRSLQDPTKAVHYYLFVSDGKLFIRPDGEMVYFKRSDPSVRIPCSVTDPKAVVSLQKSVNGLVQCPLNDSISFEPTSGFQLKTNNRRFDPAGTYVCTAGRNGVYQAIQYELVAEGSSSEQQSPESIKEQSCRRDVDCLSTEACLNNGQCGSPCSNSCGQNTSCRVVNHLANCQCLSNYVGDPYLGCRMPSTSSPQPPSDPCYPFPCGTNTRCENHNGIAKCSCAPGFQGDPYYRCYRRHNDPCNPNPCGPHSVCVNRNNYASCSCAQGFIGTPPHCRTECEVDQHCDYNKVCHKYQCRNPCEGACNDIPNTQCRVINRRPVCARYQNRCQVGYYGRDCSKIYERETNTATPTEPVDSNEVSLHESPISPCVPFPCGVNAECTSKSITNTALNETSMVALCQCAPGQTGNADMECYPVEEQSERVAVTHEEVVRHDLDDQGITQEPSSPLSSEAPSSITSSAPAVETTTVQASTLTKKCGKNAIAILSEGKSICSCPVGYTGLASIECHAMMLGMMNRLASDSTLSDHHDDDYAATASIGAFSANMGSWVKYGIVDDEPHQQSNSSSSTEVGNDVVEPEYCDGVNTTISCGNNAYCVMVNGTETCACLRQFRGNPEVGCELNCSSDADCPSEYTCSDTRCVDPCEPGLQMFFKTCGRDAYCKVEDHEPVCYCPKDLPHGDPQIHCKEKSWMPNHLPPSPLPNCTEGKDTKENNCGKNAQCQMFHDSKAYCVCKAGFYGDPYDVKGPGCEHGIQCRNSTHCAHFKECVNGRCLDPCRPNRIQCGKHAGCVITDPTVPPKCVCNIGTIRNPDGSCEPVLGALAERMAFFRSFEDF